MKKIIVYFTLLLTVIACNSAKEGLEPVVINPVKPRDEVTAFFERHLTSLSEKGNQSDCFLIDADEKESICIMINSIDEFIKNAVSPSELLPAIDFESYTLIIGRNFSIVLDCHVAGQNLIDKSTIMELNLTVEVPENHWPMQGTLYYWGIYPKLQDKPINVNVKYQN